MLNLQIDSKVPDVLGKKYKQFLEAFEAVHRQLQEVFPDGRGTVNCTRIDVQVTKQTRWVPPDENNPAIMVTHPVRSGNAVMFVRIFDVPAKEIFEKMRAKESGPMVSMAGALKAAGLASELPKEETKPAAKKAAKKAPARKASARSSATPFGLEAQENLELLLMGLVEWRNGDLHRNGSAPQTLFYEAIGEVLVSLTLADAAPTEDQVELVFNRLRGQEEVAYDESVEADPPLYRLNRKRIQDFWRPPEDAPEPPAPEPVTPPVSPPVQAPPPATLREPEPAAPPPATGLNGVSGGADLLILKLQKLQELPVQKERVLAEIREIQSRRIALQEQISQVETEEAAAQQKLQDLEALESDPEIRELLRKLEAVKL